MSKFNLKQFLSEMNANQSPGDKEFEALHPVKKTDAPAATEAQFKGVATKKDESKLTHSSNATGMVDAVNREKPIVVEGSFEEIVEQNLQELSKRTLHSYAAKAKGSAQASRAIAKIARQRDEYDRADAHVAKAHRRSKGANKALAKLKEEQLDELSKKTLGSYISKASRSASGTMASGWVHGMSKGGDIKQAQKDVDKAGKRHANIDKAVKKLTKEESEQLDEISKRALGNYITMASSDRNYHAVSATQKKEWAHTSRGRGDHKGAEHEDKQSEAHQKKADKRRDGIQRAVQKLVKK